MDKTNKISFILTTIKEILERNGFTPVDSFPNAEGGSTFHRSKNVFVLMWHMISDDQFRIFMQTDRNHQGNDSIRRTVFNLSAINQFEAENTSDAIYLQFWDDVLRYFPDDDKIEENPGSTNERGDIPVPGPSSATKKRKRKNYVDKATQTTPMSHTSTESSLSTAPSVVTNERNVRFRYSTRPGSGSAASGLTTSTDWERDGEGDVVTQLNDLNFGDSG